MEEDRQQPGAGGEPQPDEQQEMDGLTGKRVTRRFFLKLAGVVFVTTSVATMVDGCSPQSATPPLPMSPQNLTTGAGNVPITGHYLEVPETPTQLPTTRALQFFTEDEAKLMDAIAGRILPGTPDDPGAREADVFLYVDNKLAYKGNNGFVEPTYINPPFAKPYEGNTPPASQPGAEKVIYVKKDEIDRYGFQSKSTPQETYHKGLKSVNEYSQVKFQKNFVDLSEAQQDQVLDDMDNGKAQGKGFSDPSDRSFFKRIREDVIEGMFSDPVYGGNRDMVGWKLIGYPGAQRAYTPVDINTEGHVRPPQSIAQLHEFHPGQSANPDVIVPPSGSNLQTQP